MTGPATDLSTHIDALLGKPWRRYGRGPEAYDCLGLWLDLLERVTGIRLEDPVMPDAPLAALQAFHREFQELPSLAELQPLDILFCHDGQAHVTIVENSRWGVTAANPGGVRRIPMGEAVRAAQAVYRLRRLL